MRVTALVLLVLASAAPARAQVWIGRDTPRSGSVEISGGAIAAGGKDLGSQQATLTRNPTTGSESLELFRADTTLATGIGGQFRAGVYLSSRLLAEGGVQYARPQLRVRLSSDFEGAPNATASETVTSYLFTGSLLYHFGRGRVRPFVIGGGGHVRDLHAGNELVETGTEFHGGGGLKTWFGGARRKLGVRAEVVLSVRDGGVGTDDGRRTVPTAGVSLAYLF